MEAGPLSKLDKQAAAQKGETPAPRFMESVLEVLKDLDVRKDRIKREGWG